MGETHNSEAEEQNADSNWHHFAEVNLPGSFFLPAVCLFVRLSVCLSVRALSPYGQFACKRRNGIRKRIVTRKPKKVNQIQAKNTC